MQQQQLLHLPYPLFCHKCGIMHAPNSLARRDLGVPDAVRRLKSIQALFMSNALKNLMLDVLQETSGTGADFGALNTAYSTTGANEVTGGAPAYARKGLVWGAAASGAIALTATFPTFDVPAGVTVPWWSGWDAVTVGNFLFMMPLGAALPTPVAAEAGDLAGNTLFSEVHGLVADNRVVFWPGGGTGLPAGLTVGTVYWVIATGLTADVFEVSATQGGAAIDVTDEGGGWVQKCVPEVFGSQGTLTIGSGSIDLAAVV